MDFQQHVGAKLRVGNAGAFRTLRGAQPTADGWTLFLADDAGNLAMAEVPASAEEAVELLTEDGAADSSHLLAGLWAQWMRASTLDAKATVLATSPLVPYAHQNNAVYGAMLPQPLLRFLLADEPGTGKTIMAGMYLRETQRLGTVRRALVVAPAHLVSKWQADFERFFGGGLRRITSDTVREQALDTDHDLWIVSLDLASVNPAVQEAIHPNAAGWDVVVFDEAHRLTPTAGGYFQVGQMLAGSTPRALLMTATPHRGKEWLFRSLMNLVDPGLFPPGDPSDESTRQVKPPSTHFLRRMKEDLRDHDGVTPLFKGRTAHNVAVPLNVTEAAFYQEALDLVDAYFPSTAVPLGKMVYGKRAASSLYALAETLKRRRDLMGSTLPTEAAERADPFRDDEAAREEAEVLVTRSRSERAERKAIDGVLDRLVPLVADDELSASKWPKLTEQCLEANGIPAGGVDQAVVFTEYADTADWLVGRFKHAGYSAEQYSGRDAHLVRDDVRARFQRRDFQVLVSTDAGNEGIDLQTAHVLVNWDIPWSLVRLEQRMGRIHRVGQTRDVELYNLVATDTREGDVMHVLLQNFVVAANRMGGKMFDSLSLVAELVSEQDGVDIANLLSAAFDEDPSKAHAALDAANRITADRLQAVAEQAEAAERTLSSRVDVAAAVAALQNESLERINPHIVEAFLTRIAASGRWSLNPHAAGAGLFVLARPEGQSLPEGLSALVASSSDAITEARLGGAAVEDVVSLGPSEPAFRNLVAAVLDDFGADVFRGGLLADAVSATDYTLFCYEADITEFGGQRVTKWPFLVRVDDVGARDMRWEWLANLEPAEASAGAYHPAHRADADTKAGAAAASELGSRQEALASWLADSERDWQRLPSALTSEVSDPERRRSERERVQRAVGERLAALRRMAEVSVGDPALVGWARVRAGGTVAATDADSEAVAIQHVAKLLREDSWSVGDTQQDGVGYDLLAKRGRSMRCVEVKGVWGSASSSGVRMTGNELLVAQQQGHDYWLYVVDRCSDGTGTLFGGYRNPAHVFGGLFRDETVVRLPGSALKAANDEVVPA